MIVIILVPLLVLLSAAERSTEVPASFGLSQAENNFPEVARYMKKNPKIEPVLPIYIERYWVRKTDFGRKKRASPNEDRRKIEKPHKTAEKPLEMRQNATVFVVGTDTEFSFLNYIYAVVAVLVSGALTVITGMGILKTATVVTVVSHFDQTKPVREFPAVLSLQMRAKRKGKTPVVTECPEAKKLNSREINPFKHPFL